MIAWHVSFGISHLVLVPGPCLGCPIFALITADGVEMELVNEGTEPGPWKSFGIILDDGEGRKGQVEATGDSFDWFPDF